VDFLQTVPGGVAQKISEAESINSDDYLVCSLGDDSVVLVDNNFNKNIGKGIGNRSVSLDNYIRKPCLMLTGALVLTFINLLS